MFNSRAPQRQIKAAILNWQNSLDKKIYRTKIKIVIQKWLLAISCGTIFLAGCNLEPPVVDSKAAVLQLPASTENIWARSLPDEAFASLSHLPQLNDIDFEAGWGDSNSPVRFSDVGLAVLVSLNLPNLNTLLFGYCTNITDTSLTYVTRLKTVTFLGFIACPRITDNGLQTLVVMTNLVKLDLRGCTNITDKGLDYLAEKSNWQRIELGGCLQVTFDAVTNLQKRFPSAQIKKDEKEWSYH